MTDTAETPVTSHTMTTVPGEMGEIGAEGMRDLLRRGLKGAPIATYADSEPPIAWATIAEGGWDQLGVLDAGGGATLRDLVEVARVWGGACLQQPLLPSLLAKRHSAEALAHEGPVTLAIPLPGASKFYVPFGQIEGIVVALGLGSGEDSLVAVPHGTVETLGLMGRGTEVDVGTFLSDHVSREIAVVLAAEATGAAERLLQDSLAFVKEREQFGKPVGSFQAVKHKLADAAIAAELAETAVIWASERDEEAFRGALFAVQQSLDIAETAIQVHGGLGFTWEMGLHFQMRQIMLSRELVVALEDVYG